MSNKCTEIKGNLSKLDSVAANYLDLRPRFIFLILGGLLLVVFIWAAANDLLFFIIMALLVAILAYYIFKFIPSSPFIIYLPNGELLRFGKGGDGTKNHEAHCSWTFNEDNVVVAVSDNGIIKEVTSSWENIDCWRENKNYILLYYKNWNYGIIPKRWGSEDQIINLRKEISKKIRKF